MNPESVHRFVESLVTGRFYPVKAGYDPNESPDTDKLKLVDKDGSGIVSTQEINDFEMKEQQRLWVNRINNFFTMTLGLMGGMAVMQLLYLFA